MRPLVAVRSGTVVFERSFDAHRHRTRASPAPGCRRIFRHLWKGPLKSGKTLENGIDRDKIIHIDTNPLYKGYTDVFLYTDVPEETRKELAREVADKILQKLREE